jgi:hypothetical protein
MTKILLMTSSQGQTSSAGTQGGRDADRLAPTQALPTRTPPAPVLPLPILWP